MKKVKTILFATLSALTLASCSFNDIIGFFKENEEKPCTHIWDEGVQTTAPTHTVAGIKTFTCLECGETKTESIQCLTEHEFSSWVCKDAEYHFHTCSCGSIEMEKHHFDDGVVIKEATHLENGQIEYSCIDCNYKKTEDINKTEEHSFGNFEVLDDEFHIRSCLCGETEKERHIWQDGEIIKEATLDEEGSKYMVCSICNHKITVSIPCLDPKYIRHEAVPATTESSGTLEYYTMDGSDGFYLLNNGEYVLTSYDKIVTPKLYSEWNGDVDFDKFCTNGDVTERLTASKSEEKLRLTLTGSLYYGEYRPAQVYKVNNDGNHKFVLTLKNFIFSEDSGNNARIAVKIKFENGNTVDISNYYFSLYEMDITDKLLSGENTFSLIFVAVFGEDGESKAGSYVDIEKMSLKTVTLAPKSMEFSDGIMDLDTYFLSGIPEHLGVNKKDEGIELSTVGFNETWGAVIISTDWTAECFEECYIDITIAEISENTRLITQVKFPEQEMYLEGNLNSPGTHRVKLASFQSEHLTGEQTFKFRFGLESATAESSITISEIKFGTSYSTKYTVRFFNETTLLSTILVKEGDNAVYDGDTPVKQGDSEFNYEFIGWDKELNNITADTDFYAQFKPVPIEDWGEIIF